METIVFMASRPREKHWWLGLLNSVRVVVLQLPGCS